VEELRATLEVKERILALLQGRLADLEENNREVACAAQERLGEARAGMYIHIQ
jgi:hypothetical protein